MELTNPRRNDPIRNARWIWENGIIHITGHFDIELKNAGATIVDVEEMLFRECRVIKTEWNQARRQTRHTILGCDSEGCELSIVVAINMRESEMILITVF